VAITVAYAGAAQAAAIGGVFSTDRFGYTGTVVRYAPDDTSLVNPLETIVIGENPSDDSYEHRDAAFYFVDNAAAYDSDWNALMGSWWYSITTGAGNGNINGNTGIGFMQIYDGDGSTDTSLSMDFQNFDGTYWTEFALSVQGTDATAANDAARFSVYDNVHDAGTYLEYDLNITASGLQGVQTGNIIEANNHPTGVDGTFSALFTFGGDPDGDGPAGLYTIDLVFDMENWAWDNRDELVGPYAPFYDSLFVAIPEPGTTLLLVAGLTGLAVVGRRRS
jgi:hypothetical protein